MTAAYRVAVAMRGTLGWVCVSSVANQRAMQAERDFRMLASRASTPEENESRAREHGGRQEDPEFATSAAD